MSGSQKTKLKIVFGAMTFGRPNTQGARVHNADEAAKITDIFQKHGHDEIDTARGYGNGSTEEILSELDWQKRGLVMDTKLYPNANIPKLYQDHDAPKPQPKLAVEQYTHKPEDVRTGLMRSLKALKCNKVDMFYLHGPDRKALFEDTLREVDQLHKEGYFNRFGISNYMSWEGGQNLRDMREAWPLAGGFLTGRYKRNQNDFDPGSRFDPNITHSALHRGRYCNDTYFGAKDIIHSAAEKHGLTDAEVALRWIEHHCQLKEELNDAIIVGASSTGHLEGNLADLEKGPLPEDVVEALETAWLKVKAIAPKYWH